MASFESLDEEHKQSVGITLKATQWGGMPERLSAIITADTVSCSINNITACKNIVENMANYMREDFKNQFDPTQESIFSERL